MSAQLTMPCALEKMFEHLSLDIEKGFRVLPEMMEDAMSKCQRCEAVHFCDDDVESRYFTCPNRNLLDHLERLQGKI